MTKPLHLMLIGLGRHAQRVYYPLIEQYAASHQLRLACVVDLHSKQAELHDYAAAHQLQPDAWLWLEPLQPDAQRLPAEVRQALDAALVAHRIDAVIIATEPLAHHAYLDWALGHNLPVLIDKPITARPNVAHDLAQAQALLHDYETLHQRYLDAQRNNPHCVVSVLTQRRHNPAFAKVRALVGEVFERTGCPITSITVEHSDGEWRMPWEITEQHYHPFNQGYGIYCHSGYHTLDTVAWLVAATQHADHPIDQLEIDARMLWPHEYVMQLGGDALLRLFPDFTPPHTVSAIAQHLSEQAQHYGEIDGFAMVAFQHAGRTLTTANISILHNSYTQRAWPSSANRNLYTGNGRLRHEVYSIQQGPFQTIKLMAFHKESGETRSPHESPYALGGKRHCEVMVFRNHQLFPDWRNQETFTLRDLEPVNYGASDAKGAYLLEFIQAARGELPRDRLRSDFSTHALSTHLLSGIYQSVIRRQQGQNPTVKLSLGEECKPYTVLNPTACSEFMAV